jgi:hypothetical protein
VYDRSGSARPVFIQELEQRFGRLGDPGRRGAEGRHQVQAIPDGTHQQAVIEGAAV